MTTEARVEEVRPRVNGQTAARTPLPDALAPTSTTNGAATTPLRVTAPVGDITTPSDPPDDAGRQAVPPVAEIAADILGLDNDCPPDHRLSSTSARTRNAVATTKTHKTARVARVETARIVAIQRAYVNTQIKKIF